MNAWANVVGEARWNDGRVRVIDHGVPEPKLAASGGSVCVGEVHATAAPARVGWAECLAGPLGDGALQALTGGFAVAAVDPARAAVVLATDPFGIRALYYWSDRGRVVFATRLADLKRVAGAPLNLDWTSVYRYLNFGYVPGPATIFEGVSVLPPGSLARCADGKVEVSSYWDLSYPGDLAGSEGELAAALRTQLETAVMRAWPADEPADKVGTFLSGGTDSGTIAGIASTIHRPLKAYSIAFAESNHSELAYARLLAQRYGLQHHVHQLTPDDLLESLPPLTAACEQPFGNPSLVATWRCARLAEETGTDLLLAGDGGDELFGGNERYAKDRVYALYHRLPAGGRRAIATLVSALPRRSHLGNRLRNFAYRGNLANPERLYSDDALATEAWDALLGPSIRRRVERGAALEVFRDHWARVGPVHEIDRLLYVDLKTAIWGNDLVKVTSAARAAGIRVRFPFLDPTLASFTGRLGPAMKVRGLTKRYLFRRSVEGLLPREVIRKPKHGFSVPVPEWLRGHQRVRDAILEPILDTRSLVRDCVSGRGLQRLVDEHLRGQWDHSQRLWALMMLARWHQAGRRA